MRAHPCWGLADRQRATEAGFSDYVIKPIDLPLLLATVGRFLPK